MLRTVPDRYATISLVQKPTRPPLPDQSSDPHVFKHYAVHLAACWMYELTTLPVINIHGRFADCKRNGSCMYVNEEHLQQDAQALMQMLYELQPHISPQYYHALYMHIQQGLS